MMLGDDRSRPEDLAQANHTTLHDLRPRRRRLLTPQRIGQRIGRYHLAPPYHERRQHDPFAPLELAVDLEGAEDSDSPHAPECSRIRRDRQRDLLPDLYRTESMPIPAGETVRSTPVHLERRSGEAVVGLGGPDVDQRS